MAGDHDASNHYVSMTDMMVGLLFVFVIMVAFFALKLSRQQLAQVEKVPKPVYQEVVDERDALEQELRLLRLKSVSKFNEESAEQRKAIITRVQKRLDDEGVRVAVDLNRGVLRLLGVDLFRSASTQLRNPDVVHKLSRALAAESRCFVYLDGVPLVGAQAGVKSGCEGRVGFIESVFVEGHTDSVPMRGDERYDRIESNLQLSARRASNTFELMKESSPLLARFQNPELQSVLSVAAYGEQRPIASNAEAEGREKNRRIDIRISMLQPRDEAEVEKLRALISHRDTDAQ